MNAEIRIKVQKSFTGRDYDELEKFAATIRESRREHLLLGRYGPTQTFTWVSL
jgi:hypothetical protein